MKVMHHFGELPLARRYIIGNAAQSVNFRIASSRVNRGARARRLFRHMKKPERARIYLKRASRGGIKCNVVAIDEASQK